MPVRGEVKEAPKKGAVAKEVKETAPRKAPSKQEATPTKEVVKKSILEEKVLKYLSSIDVELPSKISEIFERVMTNTENNSKQNVCFMAFSKDGSGDGEVDDAYNVSVIKDILFHYWSKEYNLTGKILVLEIIAPKTKEDPHILCIFEAQ